LYPLFFSSIAFGILLLIPLSIYSNVEGTGNVCEKAHCEHPTINDPNLKIELIWQGDFKFDTNDLSPVSSMTFLGPNEILILDKNNGTVYRILNNTVSDKPLLDVNVANKRERGLLGITTSKDNNNNDYVYLYYTESNKTDGSDVCPKEWYSKTYHCIPENEPIGNRLYKYQLKDNKLINPRVLLDLPAWPSPSHNGGVVKIGPDNNLYVTVGDLLGGSSKNSTTKAQNFNGTDPDGRSGILRITQGGEPVGEGILGDSMPSRLYYAYGIRNSFGIDFDPVTGNLWDTENGPEYGDEINLVKPGFNSGWERVQGIWEPIANPLPDAGGRIVGNELLNPNSKLIDFKGKGTYSPPEFIWKSTVGPTAAKFLNSDKLGEQYENDLFVACFNLGIILHFDLSQDRIELQLQGPLRDKIGNSTEELEDITFVQGLRGITDIDVGPDGYMYILSSYMGKSSIFRITPVTT
jgi:glucose/arabinose dehydrogenase